MDTQARSAAKSLSWRVVGMTMTFLLSYLWLQDIGSSLALAIVANLAKMFAYYAHERGWNAWSWARDSYTESRTRSVVKSMSWRVVATVMTLGASLFWLHELRDAASFVGLNMSVNVLLFYVHERLWNLVRWGRFMPPAKRLAHRGITIRDELASDVAATGGD